MKKALYVYNFRSGIKTGRKRHEFVLEYLRKNNISADEFIFDEKDDNVREKLLRNLSDKAYDMIIIYGGDGTINSVVNVMLANGLSIPVGLIPGGTCNDFAGDLGLTYDIRKCLDVVINGKTEYIDAGLLNGKHYFVGTCSGGNFVSVSYKTRRNTKRFFGKVAYYANAMIKGLTFKKFHLRITSGKSVIYNGRAIIFILQNGHQAAGFKGMMKDVSLSDGRMNGMIIKECSFFRLPLLFLKAVFGTLEHDKKIVSFNFDQCRIKIQDNADIEFDGESLNEKIIDIKILSKILNVFVK